ncbi:MAG: flagellar hook-associated protein FlgK [Lachnospirales bacterium]
MSNFGTLGVAVSGLNAAQMGLSVTGHNLSNVNTTGYTRQQAIQSDYLYRNIGSNGRGTLQIGMGTSLVGIRQIRDKFLDIQYRNENSKLSYYDAKYDAGTQIETLLSELEGEYSTQEVFTDLWDSLQELSQNPSSIDARGNFINNAVTLVDKMNSLYQGMVEYQHDLNDRVKEVVTEINSLTTEINDLNKLIAENEVTGDSANDYRDARNNAIDRLTELTGCTVKERSDGKVDLFIEGNPLISNGTVYNIGLRYTSTDYSFVEPVYTNSKEILTADSDDYVQVFKLTSSISSEKGTDTSLLKGILVSRGTKPENWMSAPQPPDPTDTTKYPQGSKDVQYQKDYLQYQEELFNVTEATIPSAMKKLDTVFHSVITLINDTVAPKVQKTYDDPDNTDPIGLDGSQYLEIFVRNPDSMSRYDATGTYNEEVEGEYFTMYTLGNVSVNPEFLDADGYDKIPLSPALGGSGTGTNECDESNNTLIQQMIDAYEDPTVYTIIGKDIAGNYVYDGEPSSIKNGYIDAVSDVAIETNEALNYIEQQEIIMVQLTNNRLSMSGVSMDEEMTNMMKYQHAYNASARVVNVVDDMLDRIINKLGRVGI